MTKGGISVWARQVVLAAGLLALLPSTAQAQAANIDPLEGFNRRVFAFNEMVDDMLMRPVAKGYQAVMPDFAETGVRNFFNNLFYPAVVINQILQGKFLFAIQDATRFVVNSTFGIGGLFDIATPTGLHERHEDFGQTLGVWGFKTGPYVVLPIWGPSNVRDGVAIVGDTYMNPLFYVEADRLRYSLLGLALVDQRAELFRAEKLISGDKYLFVRDAYLQRRKYLVQDGAMDEVEDPFLADE